MYQGHRIQSEGGILHQAHVAASMAQSTIGQIVETPHEPSHCEKALLAISHNVEQLEAEIIGLAGSINSILLPPINRPTNGDSGAPPQTTSALAESLSHFNYQLQGIRGLIQDIHSRVDL